MVKLKPVQTWSPLQSVLKLSNLPADITPTQIRQILSYVKINHLGGPLRKVPSGVTVVQIYPAEIKTSVKSSKVDSSFKTSLDNPRSRTPILEESPFPTSSIASNTTAVSNQVWDPTDLVSTVGEVIHLNPDSHLPATVETEQTSIAYIHFISIGYLCQAESILEQVTVNGKRVKVRYKWWNSAPIFRAWAKVSNKLP